MTKRRPPKKPTKRRSATRKPRHAKRPVRRPALRPRKVAPKPKRHAKPKKHAPRRKAPPKRRPAKPKRQLPERRPPTKPKRPLPKRRPPKKPAKLTFADEIRAIIDRTHSVKDIKAKRWEFQGTSWDVLQGTLSEELPVDELANIARAIEQKARTRYKNAVRSTYLGVERDEDGKKTGEGFITLKSATRGGFKLENEIKQLDPHGSGRYASFRRFRFEFKTKRTR